MDPRGASRICRRGMWVEALRLAGLVGGVALVRETLGRKDYGEVKESEVLGERKQVKDDTRTALKGWIRNIGDDVWHVEETSRA